MDLNTILKENTNEQFEQVIDSIWSTKDKKELKQLNLAFPKGKPTVDELISKIRDDEEIKKSKKIN